MIISASRRTDIPAFYVDWFIDRMKQGNFELINPFRKSQKRLIKISPETIEAIVFWTRLANPLLGHLKWLETSGYRFLFLVTITGYPKAFEPLAPRTNMAVKAFKKLSDHIGPQKIIWRYDPIIYSNTTDADYHLKNFASLACQLSGFTHKAIISFLDFYKKLGRRFREIKSREGIEIREITLDQQTTVTLAKGLREIAGKYGLEIQSCAEEEFLKESGISPGACIDSEYLSQIFGLEIPYVKDKSQRPSCRCIQSVDIGQYNTCKFSCRYCYAINS